MPHPHLHLAEVKAYKSGMVELVTRCEGLANSLQLTELPLQVSNLDSPDPESGVLPVTPRGSSYVFLRFRRQHAI